MWGLMMPPHLTPPPARFALDLAGCGRGTRLPEVPGARLGPGIAKLLPPGSVAFLRVSDPPAHRTVPTPLLQIPVGLAASQSPP